MARLGRGIPHRPLITAAVLSAGTDVTGSGAASVTITSSAGIATKSTGAASVTITSSAGGSIGPDFLHGTMDIRPYISGTINVRPYISGKVSVHPHLHGDIRVNP